MIKCNDVKVCAVISRAASEKTGKDGTKFLSFSVKPTITAYNGESKEIDINVTFNGDRGRMSELTVGKRVQVTGTLSVNKRNGEVKFYLRAESVEVVSAEDTDSNEDELTFKQSIAKSKECYVILRVVRKIAKKKDKCEKQAIDNEFAIELDKDELKLFKGLFAEMFK